MYVTPILNNVLNKNQSDFFLKKLIIETGAVQIFVLPYILWMSGQVSWLLLVANILTVPIIPIIMGSGFLVVLIGMLKYSWASFLITPTQMGLTYVIAIAQWVASVDSGLVVIPPFGVAIVVGVYCGMVGYIIWWYQSQRCYT
jgi:predicted membrane metal-binding protein